MLRAPCLDQKTKKDCPKRQLGCRKECSEWQKYEAQKKIEYEQRTLESNRRAVEITHTNRSIARAERRLHKR